MNALYANLAKLNFGFDQPNYHVPQLNHVVLTWLDLFIISTADFNVDCTTNNLWEVDVTVQQLLAIFFACLERLLDKKRYALIKKRKIFF